MIKDQLQIFAEAMGYSTAYWERSIGMANGVWKKQRGVSSPILENALTAYPALSAEWVCRGTGPMLLNGVAASIVHVASERYEKKTKAAAGNSLEVDAATTKTIPMLQEIIASKNEVIASQRQLIELLMRAGGSALYKKAENV